MKSGSLLLIAALLIPAAAQADEFAPVALNSLSTVPQKIAAAPVFDQHGHAIGQVQRVVTDATGKPAALSITTDKALMVVAAPSASYDEARNIVVADITSAQVASK